MNLSLYKKQATLITLIIFAAISIGFAGASIFLNNSKSSANNQIIAQGNGDYDMAKVEECMDQPENKQQKCMDDFMTNYFTSGKTTKQILADLEVARTKNSRIENDCHPIVHAIGRMTYKQKGNIGDSFEACDQTCHSGCYHGVMERLFYSDSELNSAEYSHLTYEDMKEKIPGICDADKFNNPTNALIFQCLHGVGHAILYTLDYDLVGSLKSCDLLATDYDRSSCYGGVIMENVTAFDKKKRDLKADDPLYPCNKLDDKYKSDCYMMQTSVMSEYGLDNQAVNDQCKKTEQYMPQCFTSMGRDLSNYVRTGGADFVANACENIAKENVRPCLDGALYALADNTWDLSFAYKLCDTLTNQTNVENCFWDINWYFKNTYDKTDQDILNSCNSFVSTQRETCIDIAGRK